MEPSPLTIRLFGSLRVTVRGAPLPRVRTHSVEWLLALLVLRHGRAVSRSWLAGTLWPESGESRALQSLRDDLVRLRKALGPEAGRIQSPARDALTLDLAGAEVDVLQFDAAIQAGTEEALRDAVAVYTGPLLEGCVEEWVLTEREMRAEQCLTALEALAERTEGRGHHSEAIQYLRRAAALDPLRDSLQRRLMANLAAAGDPAAAIQVYRDFRIRLQEELVSVPDEATTRLFQDIRAAAKERANAGVQAFGRSGVQANERPSITDHRPPTETTERLNARTPERLNAPLARSVPRPLTPLIGREREVAEVRERLRQSRLVTLVGGGGVGKTRLALEVAACAGEGFPGGAVWVELASLADGALLLPTVAAALGLRAEGADHAEAPQSQLVARLSDFPPLLALDNCEHLLDTAAEVVQTLLQHCPDLHVLTTSRQRLGLPGEVAYRVPSLAVPDATEWAMVDGQWLMAEDPSRPPSTINHQPSTMLQFAAVRLFVESAAGAREGFRLASRDDAAAVCLICRRLDGIPLAIELAAARVRVLTPRQIAERLDDRFNLLTTGARGALPRHRTLRALIDWSYDQLPEAEAALLRRLSVFAGGWTLEAAEVVCGEGRSVQGVRCRPDEPATLHPTPYTLHPDAVLDLLDSLVDRSLVLTEESSGELRYRMLETVREYALEKLREHGEEPSARAGHLACFLCLAEEAGPELRGPDPEAALARLETEIDNVRAALVWAQTAHAAPDAALRLGSALWPFWEARGYLSEGRQHLRAVLQRPGLPDTPERAQALLGAAALASHQFDLDEADAFVGESLERFRSLGDSRGMATALFLLGDLAHCHARNDTAAAQSLYTEGLEACRQSGWMQGSALALVKLGEVAQGRRERPAARSLLEQGLALAEGVGDALTMARALHSLGNLALDEGDCARARPLLEKGLELRRRLGHKRTIAESLLCLGRAAQDQEDWALGHSSLGEAAAIYRELGNRMGLAWTLQGVGSLHYRQGAYRPAHPVYEESLALFRQFGSRVGIDAACNNLGSTLFHLGEPARARALHREALASYRIRDISEGIAWSLERLGVVEAVDGDPRRAARLLGAASVARARVGKEPDRWDASDLEHATTVLQERLGPGGWEAAWQEGRALPIEQTLECALHGAEA